MISHELRSPLNAILGWNRILALKCGSDPEVAAITPRVEQSAKAQLKMVNDLLDLGRMNSGKLKVEPRPIQLARAGTPGDRRRAAGGGRQRHRNRDLFRRRARVSCAATPIACSR